MNKKGPAGAPKARLALFGVAVIVATAIGAPPASAQELLVTTGGGILTHGRRDSGNSYPFRYLIVGGGLAGLAVDTVNNEILTLVTFSASTSGVQVFNRTADGNLPPVRQFFLTGGEGSTALAVDPIHDELYITYEHTDTLSPPEVLVFSRTASGSGPAPLRTLVGVDTGLAAPAGIAIDTVHDEILVLNQTTVAVYARTASGNTAPIRTLATKASTGALPTAMALDVVNDELFVANDDDTVTVFSRTASGTAPPLRTLSPPFGLAPTGIAVDTVNNELFVTYQVPGIAVFSRTASGTAGPIRVLAGSRTLLPGYSPVVTTSPPPRRIGTTTLGLYRPSNNEFYLWNDFIGGLITGGRFGMGAPGDVPVAGDFNGDGFTTVGVFQPGAATNVFSLTSNALSSNANLRVGLGVLGDLPVAGDWNGDGVSTVGLFRPSTNTFYLWNQFAAGTAPDVSIAVGLPGDLPVVGDWDGNGTTTIGLFRPSNNTFYLWNSNTAGGLPDISVAVGAPGDIPIVGDWDGNGTTTIGLFRPSNNTFYLWNSNTAGGAPDISAAVGDPGDLPVVGNWDGM